MIKFKSILPSWDFFLCKSNEKKINWISCNICVNILVVACCSYVMTSSVIKLSHPWNTRVMALCFSVYKYQSALVSIFSLWFCLGIINCVSFQVVYLFIFLLFRYLRRNLIRNLLLIVTLNPDIWRNAFECYCFLINEHGNNQGVVC